MDERKPRRPWINRVYYARCKGKNRYRSMGLAEAKAQSASRRAGDLILAYECCDCGFFHIGRADLSQRLAREPHTTKPCQQCGGQIPESSRWKAQGVTGIPLCCSAACHKLVLTERDHQRQAAAIRQKSQTAPEPKEGEGRVDAALGGADELR